MKQSKTIDIPEIIEEYISELKHTLDSLDRKKIALAISMIMTAYKNGRKVFIMGNGGSAANASHLACDLSKNTLERIYDLKEKGFKVYSLTDNTPLMTAFANDLSFDEIFLQQIRHLVEKDDLVIALSGSGNSLNVIKAVRYARKNGARSIGILGFMKGGKLGRMVDCAIIAQSQKYGPCEDVQLIIDHIITTVLGLTKNSL